MKSHRLINQLDHLLNGEIKTAWEFYQNQKKNEPGERIHSTGSFFPNQYESAKMIISELALENSKIIEREFKITDILLKVIEENNQDY